MVTLFLCGDVMLGRGIDQILADPCEPTLHESYVRDARVYIAIAEEVSGPIPRRAPPAYPWGDALAMLDAMDPDARIINLETSITRSDAYDPDKGIHYRMSPENAACLAAARIDVCTLANNHLLDWGVAGMFDTIATLDELGIARCGAGSDLDQAVRPAVIDRGDRGQILVFSVGCVDGGVPTWWAATPTRPGIQVIGDLGAATVNLIRQRIDAWRRPGAIIVLSIHWGPNWGYEVTTAHRAFAHRLVDEAGVHVVHGHSSHHVKGIEVHAGQPIFYGCGDLLTDYEGIGHHGAFRGELGLLYFVTLDELGRLSRLEMAPTQMRTFRLNAAASADLQWLATTLAQCGQPLGTSVEVIGDRLLLRW